MVNYCNGNRITDKALLDDDIFVRSLALVISNAVQKIAIVGGIIWFIKTILNFIKWIIER